MTAAEPLRLRLRLTLTQAQAVDQTTVLEWPPAGGADAKAFGLVLGHGAGTQVTPPGFAGPVCGTGGRLPGTKRTELLRSHCRSMTLLSEP